MARVRVAIAGMAAAAVALSGVPASVAEEEPLAAACADAPQGRFADVSGVHQAGIDCVGWWGVTQGTGDGSYAPGDTVNRAQMATFVARAIELSGGELPADPPTAFDDIEASVHAAAINALAAAEVVGGVGGGLYAPDREVTRAQMASFLAGAWLARTGEQLPEGELLFDDVEGNVHAAAIAAITAVGWTGGTGDGVYSPSQPVTRAQMGTFLARWLTTLVADEHAAYPPANPVPLPEPDEQPEGPGEADPSIVQGGTVVYGQTWEPTILNPLLLDGLGWETTHITSNVWPAMYRANPDFGFDPYLLDGEAELTEDPFTVTYTIRDDAVWSDGVPITVDDVLFTFEAITDPDPAWAEQIAVIAEMDGYDRIVGVEVDGDRTITFTFSEPYPAWQWLFGTILPAHVLAGEDFATVLNDGLPAVSGGPFVFDSWVRGEQLRLVRNEAYWGGEVALDELLFRFFPSEGDEEVIDQVLGGELDVYENAVPTAQLLEPLREDPAVTVDAGPSALWRHLTINTQVPGLDQLFVRQAVALALDRGGMVETILGPIDPDATAVDNPFGLPAAAGYEQTYERWGHNPAAATALLEDNGCRRGDDGVFVCDDVRLSFRVTTGQVTEVREQVQQLVQQSLAEVGIDIIIENDQEFFGRLGTPESCGGVCDFDIALYAAVASPTPVAGAADTYGCEGVETGDPVAGGNNFAGFCDEELSRLLATATTTVDPAANVALLDDAAAIIAENVPLIPLFNFPMVRVSDSSLAGLQHNANRPGTFWNSADWAYLE